MQLLFLLVASWTVTGACLQESWTVTGARIEAESPPEVLGVKAAALSGDNATRAEIPGLLGDDEHQVTVRDPVTQKKVKLPVSVEALIAIVWLCSVGAFPFIAMASQEDLSRFHIIEGVAFVSFLGTAVILATSVLTFESSHFEGARTLTIVEAVYFMAQVVTTVGYGDIVPSDPLAHLVVVVIIFFSLTLLAQVISGILNAIAQRLDHAVETKLKVGQRFSPSSTIQPSHLTFLKPPQHVSIAPVVKAVTACGFIVLAGMAFFHLYPGENKTLFQTCYMAFVTLSTTGFGAYVPVTPAGMAFGAFWMIFGVAALGNLVTSVVEFKATVDKSTEHDPVKEWKEWERLVDRMDDDKSGTISELEFLKLGLVFAGFSTEDQVERVHRFFMRLAQSKDEPEIPLQRVKELASLPRFGTKDLPEMCQCLEGGAIATDRSHLSSARSQ